jgi:acyl-coenzyme A synthetase/AMP-(fatty) acid ligase
VTFPIYVPIIQQVIQTTPELSKCKIIVVGEAQEGCHTFSEMLKTDSALSGVKLVTGSDPSIDLENDTAALMYSSGTTGPPKGEVCFNGGKCLSLIIFIFRMHVDASLFAQ